MIIYKQQIMKRKRGKGRGTDRHLELLESYNGHYACFSCRKMFNQTSLGYRHDDKNAKVRITYKDLTFTCPECKAPMHDIGREFKPPRRNNIGQWRKVELLYQRGYRWKEKFYHGWMTQEGQTIGYAMQVSHSPHAKTLRDARTDYPPQD